MAAGRILMATAPPRPMIGLVERLIPPDAREAVLGDLWERYRSPLQFAGQALAVLPFLVFAQVIRRSSWPILGLQTFILFACVRGFAPADTMSLRGAMGARRLAAPLHVSRARLA